MLGHSHSQRKGECYVLDNSGKQLKTWGRFRITYVMKVNVEKFWVKSCILQESRRMNMEEKKSNMASKYWEVL